MKKLATAITLLLSKLRVANNTNHDHDRPCPDCGCSFPAGLMGEHLRAWHTCTPAIAEGV